MKLFTRYNLISLPAITVILIVSGFFYFSLTRRILVHDLNEELEEYRSNIEKYYQQHGSFPINEAEDMIISYKKIVGHSFKPTINTVLLADEDGERKEQYQRLTWFYCWKGNCFAISIAKPLRSVEKLTRSVALTNLSSLAVVIVITLLLSLLVLKRLWRPFYETLKQMRDYKLGTGGQLSFQTSGTEEFNFMNRILGFAIQTADQDYRALKEFTENASHEIQTPLAIIRSKLDNLIQGENLSGSQQDDVKRAYQAANRLIKLNQSLLLLVKIDNQQYQEPVIINLQTELLKKLDQLEGFWLARHIMITKLVGEATIKIDPNLLDILLNNLLSNAINHSPSHGILTVHLLSSKLTISNSGESTLDETRMFQRFYKPEGKATGNGLGLSIIKQICIQSGIHIKYSFTNAEHRFELNWD